MLLAVLLFSQKIMIQNLVLVFEIKKALYNSENLVNHENTTIFEFFIFTKFLDKFYIIIS